MRASILRCLGILALGATVLLVGGCGEMKVRAGRPVTPALIESQLVLGKSTAREVQQLFGEPVGVGREQMPLRAEPRTVWSYYYEEAQVSLGGPGDYRRKFVWIFLADDRYDGYLWVSSFPEDRAR